MTATESPLDFIRRYLTAIEQGATGDALATFYTPDALQEEFPNRLLPNGAQRDLAAILAGAVRGQAVLQAQTYEIVSALVNADHLALELIWTAVLKIPLGSIPAGGTLRARFAQFIELRDGRIARQRTYDCFDPF
jgi:ketosteroid isomerase-like protein